MIYTEEQILTILSERATHDFGYNSPPEMTLIRSEDGITAEIKDKKHTYEHLNAFYEANRIRILQYNSLREHFDEMVDTILGTDYYNAAMDVYDCDRICCEDIILKVKSKSIWK